MRTFAAVSACVILALSTSAAAQQDAGVDLGLSFTCGNGRVEPWEDCDLFFNPPDPMNGPNGPCCNYSNCTFRPRTFTCREAAAGALCDAPEMCTGGSVFCPADAPHPAGYVCRGAANACDADETCDGASNQCPADAAAPDGTSCGDGVTCNGAEQCTSGVCGMGVAPDCDDGDVCTADACAEPGGCENTPIVGCCTTNAACDDGDPCTTDSCDVGMATCAFAPSGACADAGTASGDAGTDDAGTGTLDAGGGSNAGDLGTGSGGGAGCAVAPASPGGGHLVWCVALALWMRRRARRRT